MDVGGVAVTVSKPTKTKGDDITGRITGTLNYVCVSAKTVCHTVNIATVSGNVSAGSAGTIRKVLNDVGVRIVSGRSNRRVLMGNRSIGKGVEAPRTSVKTSGITIVPTMELGVIRVRQGVTRDGDIIVSNESVNACILPGTSVGLFLATSIRRHTTEHRHRLLRGNREIRLGSIVSSVGVQSGRSSSHRFTPLERTSSTILISPANGGLRRSISGVVGVVRREGIGWVDLCDITLKLYSFILGVTFGFEMRNLRGIPSSNKFVIISGRADGFSPPVIKISIGTPLACVTGRRLFGGELFNNLVEGLNTFPMDQKDNSVNTVGATLELLGSKHEVIVFPRKDHSGAGKVVQEKGPKTIVLTTGANAKLLPVNVSTSCGFENEIGIAVNGCVSFSRCGSGGLNTRRLRELASRVLVPRVTELTKIGICRGRDDEWHKLLLQH